jgi:hypothetical protein
MTKTYEPIANQTMNNNTTSTVTFSSIPQTYTDLVLVYKMWSGNSNTGQVFIRLNGITTNIYDYGGFSLRNPNTVQSFGIYQLADRRTSLYDGSWAITSSLPSMSIFNIFNYSSSSRKKAISSQNITAFSNDLYYSSMSGLYRSNNAVTSVSIFALSSATFASGSSFTLYGIKGI